MKKKSDIQTHDTRKDSWAVALTTAQFPSADAGFSPASGQLSPVSQTLIAPKREEIELSLSRDCGFIEVLR